MSARSFGATWSMVAESVSRDWFSEAVSVPAELVVKSLTASVSGVRGRRARGRDHIGGAQRAGAIGLQRQHPLTQK